MSETTGRATRLFDRVGLPVLGVIVAVGVWAGAVALFSEPGTLISRFAPVEAFVAIPEFVFDQRGVQHISATVQRLAIGLAFAMIVGTVAGLVIGMNPRVERATGGVMQFLRMVSPLAWIPIAIIVLGVGNTPVIVLVGLTALWPVIINTVAGTYAVDSGWTEVAESMGATRWETVRHIVLPAVRPYTATAFRVALGVAWIVIVPAEMLGVDSGLGYAVLDSRDRLAYSELMAIILVIGAIGFVLDRVATRALSSNSGPRSSRITVPVAAGKEEAQPVPTT